MQKSSCAAVVFLLRRNFCFSRKSGKLEELPGKDPFFPFPQAKRTPLRIKRTNCLAAPGWDASRVPAGCIQTTKAPDRKDTMANKVNKKIKQAGKGGLKKLQNAGTKRRKNVFLALIALIMLAATVFILSYGFVYGGHVEIMRVNGQPVTREEFMFYMDKEKSAVAGYFYQTYGVGADEQFWTKTYGGERPLDVLKEKAKEACVYDKTLQGLALRYGVAKDIRFSGFLSQLRETNKDRQERASRGETLYGVVQFTQLQFYLNRMSSLKSDLRDKLENVEVTVQENEVQAKYDERYDIYNNNNNITLAELHIPYIADFMPQDSIKADIKARSADEAYALILRIKRQLDEGGDFNQLCETNTGEKPVEMTIALDESSNDPSATSTILVRNAAGLQKGDCSEPFENGFGFSIVKMVDVGVERSIAYSEARSNLYNTVLAEKYDDYLANRAQSADVVIRGFSYGRIGI